MSNTTNSNRNHSNRILDEELGQEHNVHPSIKHDDVDDPTQVDRDNNSSQQSPQETAQSASGTIMPKKRKLILWGILGLLMLGIVVGLSVGLTSGGDGNDAVPVVSVTNPPAAVPSALPTPIPTSIPSAEPTTVRGNKFTVIVESIVFNPSRLGEDTTAESLALDWLINEDESELDPFDPSQTSTIETRYILALFYFATQVWNEQYDYLSAKHVCDWGGPFGGVECKFDDSNPAEGAQVNNTSVIAIWMTANKLRGMLPPEIGRLSNLKRLALGSNNIYGTIPTELGLLADLRHLDLALNDFNGTIPSELSQCSKLQSLNLVRNSKLTGPIPAELASLEHLQSLKVASIPEMSNFEVLCDGSPPAQYIADCNSQDDVCTCCTTPCLPNDPVG